MPDRASADAGAGVKPGPQRSDGLGARLLRRVLHAWFLLSRGLTLGVRGAVLDAEGRVLLVRHTYVPGWHLPGGGVEVGETAQEALRRELAEEAAIALEGEPELHGIFFEPRLSRRDHVLIYVVRSHRPCPGGARAGEIAEARWFSLDDLPDGTTDSTRARLAEIAGRSRAGATSASSLP